MPYSKDVKSADSLELQPCSRVTIHCDATRLCENGGDNM